MPNYEDLKKMLEIDEFQLDKEWIEFAGRFSDICDLATIARLEVDVKSNQLEEAMANVYMDCKNDPKKYGISKITEGYAERVSKFDPEVKEKSIELLIARHEQRKLENLVKAMEAKRKALENLVHLFALSYNAEPRCIEGDNPQTVKKLRSRSVNQSIKDGLNKKETEND